MRITLTGEILIVPEGVGGKRTSTPGAFQLKEVKESVSIGRYGKSV